MLRHVSCFGEQAIPIKGGEKLIGEQKLKGAAFGILLFDIVVTTTVGLTNNL